MQKNMDPHLEPAQLQAFNRGELSLTEIAAMEEHLNDCLACQTRLIEVDRPDKFTTALRSYALQGTATLPESKPETSDFTIPGYHLGPELGRGGFGIVYHAVQVRLERPVALKVLFPRLGQDPLLTERFLREARIMGQLNHPHIVRVYDVGRVGSCVYLAMELIEGMTLEACLKNGPLPPADFFRHALQIGSALAYLHGKGLLHRDIKPANVLLDAEGNAKLADFGLARFRNPVDSVSITSPQSVLGTPAYMAPEQARGETVDERSDLFSFGALLYHLATGKLPHPGSTSMEVLIALATYEPADPHLLRRDLSRELSDLLLKMLAKDPIRRPASVQAVVEGLRQLQADGFSPAPARPRKPRSQGPFGGHRMLLLTLPLLAPLLLWLAAIFVRIDSPEGTLIVKIEDDEALIAITGNDGKAMIQDKSTDRTFTLRLENGEIHVFNKDGTKHLVTKHFKLRRGEKTVLEVSREEMVPSTKRQPLKIPQDLADAPWQPLFNGKDLAGWKYPPLLPGDWKVEEGLLIGTGRPGWLFSERENFGDFHLRAEFKVGLNCDSGIFFWTPFEFARFPDGKLNPVYWHEANIWEDGPTNLTGCLDGQGFHGVGGQRNRPSNRDWMTLEITAVGKRVISRLDGKEVAEVEFPEAKIGCICLQTPILAQTTISFRKIEIKSLVPTK